MNIFAHTFVSFSFYIQNNEQYVNRSAAAVRGALKEPAKRKAMENGAFSYKYSVYEAGKQGPKTPVKAAALS